MKFYIYTLGCKVNIYESEAMAGILEESGRYEPAASPFGKDGAGLVIINSCSVTEEAEKKAAKFMRRLKRENPAARVVFTGCMSQVAREKALSLGADSVMGNGNRNDILRVCDVTMRGEGGDFVIDHAKGELFEQLSLKKFESLTRANLKIQDGCDCFCAYCIIPYTRGRVRSMTVDNVKKSAGELVASGHREIVLTGINLGMYGKDNGSNLAEAVEAARGAGAERIRLGSLEIDLLSPEILKRLSEVPGFCPHFHTSLQSGSETVLRRMNRKYTPEEYFRRVSVIRDYFENPAITTDIIVGFPGETDEEFNESAEFAKRVGFSRVHVFPYSRRPGTVAARLPGQVPESIKKHRADIMGRLALELASDFAEKQLGTLHNVLFETFDGEYNRGHTENYLTVSVKSEENLKNRIERVKIAGKNGEELIGEFLK